MCSGLVSWTQWTKMFNTVTNELYSLLLCVSSHSVVTAESTFSLIVRAVAWALRFCLCLLLLSFFCVARYHIHTVYYHDVRNLLSLLLLLVPAATGIVVVIIATAVAAVGVDTCLQILIIVLFSIQNIQLEHSFKLVFVIIICLLHFTAEQSIRQSQTIINFWFWIFFEITNFFILLKIHRLMLKDEISTNSIVMQFCSMLATYLFIPWYDNKRVPPYRL